MATASDALDYFNREIDRLAGLKAFAEKAVEAGGIDALIAAQQAKLAADKNDAEQVLVVLNDQIAAKTAEKEKIGTDLQTARDGLARLNEAMDTAKAAADAEAEKVKADAQAEADQILADATEKAAKIVAGGRASLADIVSQIETKRDELDQIASDKAVTQAALDDLQNKLAAFKASIGAAGA